MKKHMIFSMLLIGFVAISAQIIFMRELLIVFYGNELSTAFVLAGWLVGGAIGSAILGRYAGRIRQKVPFFAATQVILGIALLCTTPAVRSIKSVLNMNPGEIMPLFPMIVSSCIVVLPVCAILGFLFALACRMYGSEYYPTVYGIGSVYVFESVGAMAGGVVTSFFLVRMCSSFQAMAALCLLLTVSASVCFIHSAGTRFKRAIAAIALAVVCFEAAVLLTGIWERIDRKSLEQQWRGYELTASRNSIYGNIVVTKKGAQFSFFDNGLHLYTIPDKLVAEEAVHFAMLEHPAPSRVLLIGGGVSGLLEEILKYPVSKVDYVELDALIVRMARENLPRAYNKPLDDKRVAIIPGDGRLFVKTTSEKYDVIIMNLGDPYTAQLNRFYTEEFFKETKQILRAGGLISFGLSSSDSYMGRELREYLGSIYATVRSSFADVKMIPGETAYFLATDAIGSLTYDYNVLMERMRSRGAEISYVREYYLYSRLSDEKVTYMKNSVFGENTRNINRDLTPISYYYDMVYWAAKFKGSGFNKMFKMMNGRTVWGMVVFLCVLLFWIGLPRKKRSGIVRPALLAMGVNGFTQMTFQIVILLGFQVIFGYVFYELGFIITAFMAGLALGGWRAVKVSRSVDPYKTLLVIQAAICACALALPVFFNMLIATIGTPVSRITAHVAFMVLPLACGFAGGFLFPVVNKAYLGAASDADRAGGLTYGIDLSGSCIGALMSGTFFIPILGIQNTCFIVAIANLVILVILSVSRGKKIPEVSV